MDEYKNLERLARDADDAVGLAYDVGTCISFLFFVFLLYVLGSLLTNALFGGDAPDVVDWVVLGLSGYLTSLGFKAAS